MSKDSPSKLPESIKAPNLDQIRQIAKTQNSTLAVYSFIYDGNQARLPARLQGRQPNQQSNLFIWVVNPNGSIDFRQVRFNTTRQSGTLACDR